MSADLFLAFSSLCVALAALYLSWYSGRRLRRQDARRQFLALEGTFFSVLEDLPPKLRTDTDLSDWTDDEINAAKRYWFLCHTEWLATKGSGEAELARYWDDYYSLAQVSGRRHPPLAAALEELLHDEPELCELWNDYLKDLNESLHTRGHGIPSNAKWPRP